MLAICLLTADRPDYTFRTLTTLNMLNRLDGRADIIRLHADDGSKDGRNAQYARLAGFSTVYTMPRRAGIMHAVRWLWNDAAERGADWILHLENDCASVRPLPTRRDADSIRLYGATKGPGFSTGEHIMGTKERIFWRADVHGWQRGEAHWGGQPSITRTTLLLDALRSGGSDARGARQLKDVSMYLQRIDTVRPVHNVMDHFGLDVTPGFKR